MIAYLETIFFLLLANIFMTFAWYAHLKDLNTKPLWIAIFLSWGLAFFEYIFQVPANRIGFNHASIPLPQLKIIQEIITLITFVPFSIYYMNQPVTWNFLYAGICLMGAAYFIFKP
jgi:uncharacterized protein (DUF486 family)